MSSLVIYTSDDGQTRINLRVEADISWLNPDSVVKVSLTPSSVAQIRPIHQRAPVNQVAPL